MQKRSKWILSFFLMVVLVAAFFIIIQENPSTGQKGGSGSDREAMAAISGTQEAREKSLSSEMKKNLELKSEELPVKNNTPEFDVKAELRWDAKGSAKIYLLYYIDGGSQEREIESTDIPELAAFSGSAGIETAKTSENTVIGIYLNAANSKLYFFIEGINGVAPLAVYACSLKKNQVKMLFADTDIFMPVEPYFSKDGKYMAFNFRKKGQLDPTSIYTSACDNDTRFQMDGKPLFQGGKTEAAGSVSAKVNDYNFISWQSASVMKIRHIAYQLQSDMTTVSGQNNKEVIFDIESMAFVNSGTGENNGPDDTQNADDKAANSSGAKQESGNAPQAESSAMKTLRQFYTCLADSRYTDAMDMLDEDFKLQMKMFRQFGIAEVTKRDLDVREAGKEENFSYVALLKSSKIEKTVAEETRGNISVISYFQTMSAGEGEPVRIPLSASLKNYEGVWKFQSLIEKN